MDRELHNAAGEVFEWPRHPTSGWVCPQTVWSAVILVALLKLAREMPKLQYTHLKVGVNEN
jgi:hypothetical protein